MTTALVGIVFPVFALANGYSELLPNSSPVASAASSTPTDKTDQLKHLLLKYQDDLNSCAALSNIKKETYISKTMKVVVTSRSAVFRLRKSEQEAPQLQLEKVTSMSPLKEACILRIFRNSEFEKRLQGIAINGRIVVNFDCNLDVERYQFSLDKINYQCKAKWGFYDMSAAYPETDLKTWK